jgi:hypothetical protein
LAIDGQVPVRADPAIGELASLLHDRLIGELTIQREADAEDWRALLLLLARAPEEILAVQLVGIYPVGNLVRLYNGEIAVVLKAHASDPTGRASGC